MYPNYYYQVSPNGDQERFGGFVFPFLLGGVTGAAIAPNFWGRPNNHKYYPNPYQYNYYYYPPYYYR